LQECTVFLQVRWIVNCVVVPLFVRAEPQTSEEVLVFATSGSGVTRASYELQRGDVVRGHSLVRLRKGRQGMNTDTHVIGQLEVARGVVNLQHSVLRNLFSTISPTNQHCMLTRCLRKRCANSRSDQTIAFIKFMFIIFQNFKPISI
jgi:hypothetical protein